MLPINKIQTVLEDFVSFGYIWDAIYSYSLTITVYNLTFDMHQRLVYR